jgi:hypothetical protein
MKFVSSSRRQLVMAVLLGLALLGGAMRHWAPDPSLQRDIGTLLLVLWLPAVGNLVAFIIARLPRRPRAANGFAAARPFKPHVTAEISPLPRADVAIALAPFGQQCTLIVGNQGFTARLAQPLVQWFDAGTAGAVDLELLHPEPALRELRPGAAFYLAAGTTAIGQGRVIAN